MGSRRGGGPSGLADVLDVLLDKGLVIDAFVRVSLIGIENPRRRVSCAECPGGALAGSPADAAREPQPATSAA